MDASVSASLSSRELKRACKANQVPSARQRTKGQMRKRKAPRTVDTLPDEDPGVRYVTSYSLSPPKAGDWMEYSHRWSMSDFAHARTGPANLGGIIGARLAQDANNCLTDLAIVRCLGNEDKKAWLFLNDATEQACPNYDVPDQIDAHDGQKCATAAHQESFENAKEARDKRHRKGNILARAAAKGGGQTACELYEKAFAATTLEKLATIKATFPPAIADYLSQIRDKTQYPVTAGGWYGHCGSSPAESHNSAMGD
ncbi:hypothetical protein M885DRAFT_575894, partial [Pelagophyceae sp. CCMP2097]